MPLNEETEDREIPVEDEETTVDLDAADEGGEDEGETGKPSRDERRRERKRILDENEELRRQSRDLSERLSRSEAFQQDVQRQLAETRTQITRAQERGDDPLEGELKEVRQRLRSLASSAARGGDKIPEAELREMESEADRLRDRELELVAQRTFQKNAPRRDPGEDDKRAFQIANRDIFSNPAAKAYARAEFMRLTNHPNAALRKPDNQETLELAMENTRKEFGIGRAAPTEVEKARTSGVSRGGTGGGGRENVVQMSDFHKGLADKAFKHIKDPKERYTKWAKGPGRKMLERKKATAGKR